MYHYSGRLPWSLSKNRFSDLIEAKRRQQIQFLDLTDSNPTSVLANYPHEEIVRAFGTLPDLEYRPDPMGYQEAREAITAYYEQLNVPLSPRQIALTSSTSEAYALLFKLLCDPGDEILVPTPSYPLFEHLAALESVRTVVYPLFYDGSWYIDFDHLEANISERTRAIVLVNPNNPTGSFIKPEELRRLLQIAARKSISLIADEVFSDYHAGDSAAKKTTLAGNNHALSFCLNGLSKLAGMPQLKLGWIVVNGPPQERAQALSRLEFILDTYLSVNVPVQLALSRLLEIGSRVRGQLQLRIRENLRVSGDVFENAPVRALEVEGGWSAILQLPNIASEDEWITRLLHERSVIVQPGYFFDFLREPFVVVSLITERSVFERGIRDIGELCSER